MKNNIKALLPVLFAMQLLCSVVHGQMITFQQIYQTTVDQSSRDVISTSDGGYLIAAMTENQVPGDTNILMIKTNQLGDTLWTRIYGGSQPEYPYSMLETGDGHFLVAGYTASYGGGSYDMWLLKLTASGDTVWTKTYGGPGDDQAKEIIATADGNYMIVGRSNGFGGINYDIVLIKINPSGVVSWSKTYGGPMYETGRAVKQCPDGGYIIVGQTLSYGQGGDIYLVKTGPNGDTTWTKHYGGPMADDGNAIVANADGSFTLTAETNSFGAGEMDVQVMKTNSGGTILWNRYYGGTDKDVSKTIYRTSDGGYIIGAISRSFGWQEPDMWLLKISDAMGDTVWTRHFGSWDHEHCHSARPTADGGYAAVGHSKSYGPKSKIMFIKLNSQGRYELVGLNEAPVTEAGDIFPNPTDGNVRIDLGNDPFSSFSIYNSLGETVICEAADPSNYNSCKNIDMKNHSPGIYFVNIRSTGHSVTKRFILK